MGLVVGLSPTRNSCGAPKKTEVTLPQHGCSHASWRRGPWPAGQSPWILHADLFWLSQAARLGLLPTWHISPPAAPSSPFSLCLPTTAPRTQLRPTSLATVGLQSRLTPTPLSESQPMGSLWEPGMHSLLPPSQQRLDGTLLWSVLRHRPV